MRLLGSILALLLVGLASAAELPPPTTNPSLAGNIGGVWYGAGFTFSDCTVSGSGVITCPGTISSYPSAGIVQSSGSGWSTSITAGSGVVAALGNGVNAANGLLTYSGAFGTPTSLTLTNATGLPTTGLTGTLQATQFPALTGDVTTTAGSLATTLATVNSNVGSFGSATSCVTLTANGKGLVTAVSAATCTPAIGSITGFGSNVETALTVAVGTAGSVVINGGVLGTPSSGVANNLTGTATGLTAGAAQGLVSATTTVSVSGATAPTSGQVLTATSSTSATWQTPSGGGVTTFSAGSTGFTPSTATAGAITLSGTLATANGGTGQNFGSSTGVLQVSGGTMSATTTPTLTATNVTGIPPHQISVSLECASTTGSSSSTAYTCSTTPTFTPANGDQIFWLPGANDATNTTTTPTLNVNGTTTYQIVGNGNRAVLQGDAANAAAAQGYTLSYSTNATAPCSSHCWMLNSGQRNNWLSTYVNATNSALQAFYACNPQTTNCRIWDNADSEHTCWLTSTCAFGPQHEVNLWAASLLSIYQRRGYPLYSTGVIGPISIVSTTDLFSNGVLPGITCTGTVTQVSLSGVGPQQATGALTGGGTLQMASGAVCTVAVSTFAATPGGTVGAFNRFRVYCAINSTTGTMTVTISGQSAATACTGTNASPLAQAFTVTNTAGTTALTVAITCTTGTCNLGGYEEIYTTNNFGYSIDAFEATGGANSYWLGGAAGNVAYLKLAGGTVALLDIAIGINDAAGSISSATVNANIATFIAQAPGASVLIWSSFAYTGTGSTNYPAIQQGEQQLALTNGYDFLNTQDNSTNNTSVNYWSGCQNSDFTHPTDMCAGSNFAQWWAHINGSEAQASLTFGANQVPYVNGFISFIDGTDTAAMNGLSSICYATSATYCGNWRIVSAPSATFQSMWAGGIAATTQTASNGAVAPLGSWTLGYSTTAGTQTPASAQFAIISDSATGLVYEPFNRVPLTTAFSIASTTPGNITGWSWPILSGQTLIIECDGMYQAAATGGLRFEVTGPTMTGFQLAHAQGINSTAASMASPPAVTAISTLTTGIAVTTATTNYYFHAHIYANASAGGTLQIQGASAAAVNMTIGVGSSCVVH